MSADEPVYTLAQVADHGTVTSLWLAIGDGVYDVTGFLSRHPGGARVLEENGGKDATHPFERVGHTSNALNVMKRYRIGQLAAQDQEARAAAGGAATRQFTLAEVAKYNGSNGQYYIVIDNKVYDVTDFLGAHPGGREPLTHNSGTDATDEFAAIGHSANAKRKLNGLQIGVLVPSDRRSAKPATGPALSYEDVTRESLRAQSAHTDGGAWPIGTTLLIVALFVISFGGLAVMIMADGAGAS